MFNQITDKYKYFYPLLCLILFAVHVALFWPGVLSPDSQGQYEMAVKGIYSDHHPFIMSWLWRYLDTIYPGPALMLIFHLALLHASIWIIAQCFDNRKMRYFIIFTSFIPQVLIYSGMIWKDVGFAYCYLFVCSVLCYVTVREYKLKIWQTALLLLILLYGTMVKFQAQYLAPIVVFWMVLCLTYNQIKRKLFSKTMDILLVLFVAIYAINHHGPKVTEDHSWQYVKFYDLAAISVELNKSVIPKINSTPRFTITELKKRFNHQRVDDLIFIDPILKKGSTEKQRDALLDTWAQQIREHPLIYLKHRCINMAYATLSMPDYDRIQLLIEQHSIKGSIMNKVLKISGRTIGFFILAHLLTVCLGFCYIIFAIRTWRLTRYSRPLFFLNFIGMGMVSILLFCTMAGAPRYTYIVICLVHCSHGFAYMCYQSLKLHKRKQQQSVNIDDDMVKIKANHLTTS